MGFTVLFKNESSLGGKPVLSNQLFVSSTFQSDLTNSNYQPAFLEYSSIISSDHTNHFLVCFC